MDQDAISEHPAGKPRLLVIGARGFLGTHVDRAARHHYDVIRANRSRILDDTDAIIDIADPFTINRAFADMQPDAVLLLAAISDIDRCQRDRQLAMAVNLHGAEAVANACARAGVKLLFTSTGAVFDGLKHGYSEEDPVSPVSFYGETKARAESAIAALVPSAIILRVSLVLGFANKPGTNSLLDSLILRWGKGEAISASTIESRNPIDTATLSRWLLELLAGNRSGIFHAGSTDAMTRYELAKAIAGELGVRSELVQPEHHPPAGRAPRGPDHLLLTRKIGKACPTQPPSCAQVIERSLNEVAEGSLRAGI